MNFRPIISLILLAISVSGLFAQSYYEKCGTDELLESLIERDPMVVDRMAAVEAFTEEWIAEHSRLQANQREIITIPVVVHVLWNSPEQNISDLQIQSQIGILNEDFRLRNANVRDIPEEFIPLAADVEIEFCLATLTPTGDITDGITRTETSHDCIGNFNLINESGVPRLFYDYLGGQSAWDTRRYLNIWVAPTCGSFLGYGFSPGQSISPAEDGVVIDTRYFGNVCNDGRNHHLGRTATHEIGHYFNLRHTWGSKGCDPQEGDFVEDTPLQYDFYSGCPQHPVESCGSNDMFMNFMDYTDDACISMFTHGQKARMYATLNGFRYGLLNSDRCLFINSPDPDLSITVFPNPVSDCIYIDYNANFSGLVDVYLFSASGKTYYHDTNNASNIRSIDATHLPDGVYFLHLTNGGTEVTERVLVRH